MTTDIVMEFAEVQMEQMGTLVKCRMKLTDSAISWKNTKTGKLETMSADDVAAVEWVRLANTPALKLTQKNLASHRFGGFLEADFERVKTFAKANWDLELESVDPSVKGWNYGKAKFEGSSLNFKIDSKPAFEVPLKNVNNCTTQKSEVVLEFQQNEECPVGLMEMRFHVPTDPDDENAADPVEDFKKAVLRYAGIVEDDGRKPLVTFKELFCNTPRGKYDFNIFSTHLSLHGKTYDYKIPADTILRMFLLQNKDGNRMFFVISLDPPLRQGQTRYPYLVLEFMKEEEVDVELNLTDEQIEEKYQGKLQRSMSGPTYEVFCRVLRTLLKQKITVPGSFVGASGTAAIGCAFKQANGFLYPLERGFIFVHKPPMYLRFEEISSVNFARSDHSTKSFDFEVETRGGYMYPFSGIEKEEYTKLFDFVQKKNVRIRNSGKSVQSSGGAGGGGGFSDSDEDEKVLDPYKERLKKEAKAREEEASAGESDSEDEDSDYDPEHEFAVKKKAKLEMKAKGESDSEDTGSDSEPDLEYDSEAGSTSTSGSSESSADADDNDDPDEEAKPKKVKKPAGERKAGSKKRKKDPNAPKKGSTAFMIWLNANRADIKEEGMAVTEVAKKAGELWKAMDDKSEWEAKAVVDKERYLKEMEEYRKNKPADDDEDDDAGSDSKASSSKPKSTTKKASKSKTPKAPTTSPKKNVKSKEYISDSSSSDSGAASRKPSSATAKDSDGDSDDEPLAAASKKESSSSDDDAPPTPKKDKKEKGKKKEKTPSDSEDDSDD